MIAEGLGNRVYGLKDSASGFRILNLEAVSFVKSHHQLERIDGVQAESSRAEQRLVIRYVFGGELKH
jgi:hypothetical protein